jgi:protein SCO1/2
MAGGAPSSAEGAGAPGSPRVAQGAVWTLLGLVIAAVSVAGLWSLIPKTPAEPLPVLGELPAFSLTESGGSAIGLEALSGRPWVADFIFTRCTGICPMLSTRMLALQEQMSASSSLSEVRLVSISVDPQHDTEEVLRDYGLRNGADMDRWLFLTGEWEETRRLVGEGFKLGVSQADPAEVEEGELVTHSDRLVLVDGRGRIRGYYHGSEDDCVERILADLQRIDS